MTAEELIKYLQRYPPDTPVLLPNHEGGFDPIEDIMWNRVQKSQVNAKPWGEYDYQSNGQLVVVLACLKEPVSQQDLDYFLQNGGR